MVRNANQRVGSLAEGEADGIQEAQANCSGAGKSEEMCWMTHHTYELRSVFD